MMKPIQLLIPMSGQGTRYQRAGYREPKPLIPVSGVPMIERLLARFPREWPAHFVMAKNHAESGLPEFLKSLRPEATQLFIDAHAKGPGHAVLAALDAIPEDAAVLVSYCDYDMVWDATQFQSFVTTTDCDACLISYRGFHAHYLNPVTYAYSRLDGERVVEVREKGSFTDQREHEYASSGGYYFRSAGLLKRALEYQFRHGMQLNGEAYTSLTVEALIRMVREEGGNADVRVFEIPFFCQWGTPEDLRNFEFWEKSYRAALRSDPTGLRVDQVLMPMAGLGTRFKEITPLPKAFIPIAGQPMFRRAISTLPLATDRTVIVALREHESEVRAGAPEHAKIVALTATPSGQALSVEAGLANLDPDREVIVSACDHGVVLNAELWRSFRENPDCDAAIFTICGYPGTDRKPLAFAYVEAAREGGPTPLVRSVSVKRPISENPSDDPLLVGTFWFRSGSILASGIAELKKRDVRVNGELYLDSVFDLIAELGGKVRMIPLDGYLCWGDPDSLAEALYWQEFFSARSLTVRPRFPGIPPLTIATPL